MKYFKGIETIEEAKKEYKKLAMQYHPDRGGNEEEMKIINNDYEILIKLLATSKEEEKEVMAEVERFKDVIDKIIDLEGINIEILKDWVWISGNTKPHRETLKAAGFYWASKKMKWYYREEQHKCSSRGKKSFEEIKQTYGSTKVNKKNYSKNKSKSNFSLGGC